MSLGSGSQLRVSLSADKKAERGGARGAGEAAKEALTFENLMNSPWKVRKRIPAILPAAWSACLLPLVRYGAGSLLNVSDFVTLSWKAGTQSREHCSHHFRERLKRLGRRENMSNQKKVTHLVWHSYKTSPFVRQGLLGGLSNVIEVMRGEGAPPTAVRAVVAGALAYLDAELLNALVLRRDCCSLSAVKALQAKACSHSPVFRP